MPLYEYECQECAHRTEVIQRLNDPPLAACPSCGGAVKRLLSAPSFQFKGTGWYVTDYAKKGAGKPAAESGDGSKSEGSQSERSPSKGDQSKGDQSKGANSDSGSSSGGATKGAGVKKETAGAKAAD